MRELVIVVGVAGALGAVSALFFAPWASVVTTGAALAALGLAFGIPTSVVYHVLLHRALARRGVLPRGWIWRPLELHPLLLPEERPSVLGFCYAGGAGFVVLCVGLLIFLVGGVSGMMSSFGSG